MDILDEIIQYLLIERGDSNTQIPNDMESKQKLYRALVNVRNPQEISSEFLKREDEYLQKHLLGIRVTDVKDIMTIQEKYFNVNLKNPDKISFWKGDITKLKVDVIVNAANSAGLRLLFP